MMIAKRGVIEWVNFLMSVCDTRKEICTVLDQRMRTVKPALLQSTRSMAFTAMAVEYE